MSVVTQLRKMIHSKRVSAARMQCVNPELVIYMEFDVFDALREEVCMSERLYPYRDELMHQPKFEGVPIFKVTDEGHGIRVYAV